MNEMYICSECGFSLETPGYCPHHGTPLASTCDAMLGRSIGKFRLARRLGSGAMANVYLGVHAQIGSRVAIKILTKEVAANTHLVQRFFFEAKATTQIRHDGIVKIIDLDVLPDGEPYIIMEYLEGDPMSVYLKPQSRRGTPASRVLDSDAYLDKESLPLDRLVTIVEETLDALAAAHAAGIVHRDIKPSNIFVTSTGRAKIIDFGVAKLRQGVNLTAKGAIIGTPHFMAPEQIQGKSVDGRADLYAVGVLLFRMAAGRYPFDGESPFEIWRAHLQQPTPLIRSLRVDLTAAFQSVVSKALEKDPDERFESASEMCRALHAAASLDPSISSRPLTDQPTEIVVPDLLK